jgi:hypothetical protein
VLRMVLFANGIWRSGAVGSGFGGRQMPLQDAGYRRTTLDARWGRFVQSPLRHKRWYTPEFFEFTRFFEIARKRSEFSSWPWH